jgi:hypothetical protein
MEPQPPAIRFRNRFRLPEKRHEKEEHLIRIHPSLEFQVPGKIFAPDLLLTPLELQRRVERVVDFFHESDQVPDIAIRKPAPRIIPLQLID